MVTRLTRTISAAVVLFGLLAVSTTPGFAQKRTNTNSNGITSTDRDTGPDRAKDRDSSNAANNNSNGVNSSDRDKGLGRAQDRAPMGAAGGGGRK